MSALREALAARYEAIAADGPWPDWAHALRAPIPFVGDDYGTRGPRILIYGSAENINTQLKDRARAPWLPRRGQAPRHALERHAWTWAHTAGAEKRLIGIAPFEDGPLRAAAALLWRWRSEGGGPKPPADRIALTESVAVANLSKFAHRTTGKYANKDVTALAHLKASFAYLAADLAVLQPDIVLIAKSGLSARVVDHVRAHAPADALIVEMWQGSGLALRQPGNAQRQARAAIGALPPERPGDVTLARAHCDDETAGWTAWRQLLRARYLQAAGLRVAAGDALPAGPLTGIKVLDLSRVLAGPYCSMALGDMGAEVIKIERPDGGDDTRRFGPPFVDGVSTYYLAINRNKRSVALNLKHADAQAALWTLIEDADVLLENFRPGTMERLGFSYAACKARNPRLVYCSVSAFGHHGLPEWSRKPGYDVIMQGMGGIPSLTGPVDAGPHKVGASIADVVSGMYATQGIMLALFARTRTGQGQHVDVSMFDGQVSMLTYLATAQLNAGVTPGRLGNRHLSVAPYSTFPAKDGHLNLAVANQKLWKRFCDLLARPDLFADPRFETNAKRVEHNDALEAAIVPALRARTVDAWLTAFEEAGIPAGPVLTIDQVLEHPQLAARDMIVSMQHPVAGTVKATGVPLHLSETPGGARTPPPTLGQHTDEVLGELGYDDAAIAAMRAAGAIG